MKYYKCDECFKAIDRHEAPIELLFSEDAWADGIARFLGFGSLPESREHHFCSIKCLVDWAKQRKP